MRPRLTAGIALALVALGPLACSPDDPRPPEPKTAGGGAPSSPAPGAPSAPGTATPAAPGAPATFPVPPSGVYGGVYEVPVQRPELTAAATFPSDKVRWTVKGDTATLDYDLPPGLVGGKVDVEFTGTVDGAAMKAQLVGRAGTAECSWSTGKLRCFEVMRGILPLSTDMRIVRERAAAEYKGPVEDRLQVVAQFGTDPIGIVEVDPAAGGAKTHDDD